MVKEVVGMETESGIDFVMDLVDHITQPQFLELWNPCALVGQIGELLLVLNPVVIPL